MPETDDDTFLDPDSVKCELCNDTGYVTTYSYTWGHSSEACPTCAPAQHGDEPE